jgi:hypothetical protein
MQQCVKYTILDDPIFHSTNKEYNEKRQQGSHRWKKGWLSGREMKELQIELIGVYRKVS